jgi:hypothetical protein
MLNVTELDVDGETAGAVREIVLGALDATVSSI